MAGSPEILGAGHLDHPTRVRRCSRSACFTRFAAVPIVLFLLMTNFERWRIGRYFWNQLGLEYTLMWTIAALYFLVHGGGAISLDRLIGRAF